MLTLYVGPMWSGKSAALISVFKRLSHTGQKSLVFRPKLSSDDSGIISSREVSDEIKAISVEQMSDIEKAIYDGPLPRFIFFEEAQFLPSGVIGLVHQLTITCDIYASGVDKDFRGLPFFGPIGPLMAMADDIHKLTAVCKVCRSLGATYSQRLTDGQPASAFEPDFIPEHQQTAVVYEPRCARCFVAPANLESWQAQFEHLVSNP